MKNISIPSDKLKAFAAKLEAAQLVSLVENAVDCECNRNAAKTSVKVGGKYARVDIGTSGRYMVVMETGEIFGIKAYGVIHRGHAFGTLDTINEWDWRNYRACPALAGAAKDRDEARRAHMTARLTALKSPARAEIDRTIKPSATAAALAVVSPLAWRSIDADNSTEV